MTWGFAIAALVFAGAAVAGWMRSSGLNGDKVGLTADKVKLSKDLKKLNEKLETQNDENTKLLEARDAEVSTLKGKLNEIRQRLRELPDTDITRRIVVGELDELLSGEEETDDS